MFGSFSTSGSIFLSAAVASPFEKQRESLRPYSMASSGPMTTTGSRTCFFTDLSGSLDCAAAS